MSDLDHEIRAVSRRLLTGRIAPILVAGSALLIVAVHFIAPTLGGAHTELGRLSGGNEIAGFVLLILAFLTAYLLVAPDLHDEFESMTATGGSHPLTFAAARVLIGVAGLFAAAVVLGAVVEALDFGGRYQAAEAVHMVVIFANAVPVFMLALVLICLLGRVAGFVGTFVLISVGGDAAYQRGAVADHFIDPNGIFSLEQTVAWLGPRPLMDSLPGIGLMDQAVALNQFPVREGQAVWGADLIQVSGSQDLALYVAYILALAIACYLVCRLRAGRARSRFHLVPSWLERSRTDRAEIERE
ncbi:MAG TPA: hypothetical protein VGJ79_14730 [Candidatus Dormibacteraeota bacterium]